MYSGKIVCSLCGHDKGIYSVVVGNKDGRLLVCDGKLHRLDNLKPKNPKHLRFTDFTVNEDDMLTDKKIRKAIFKCFGSYKEEE